MTTKDSYEIIQHNIKVSQLAEEFARYLELPEETVQMIAVAGVFIDIGKIAMDYKVFSKEKPLTDEEFEYIKQHASKSTEILIQSNLISRDILTCIVHHHESYNGEGYPTKVKGDAIPMGARVLKLCDVYYALSEKRPYRDGYSYEEGLAIINRESEKYDPELLVKFNEFINNKASKY